MKTDSITPNNTPWRHYRVTDNRESYALRKHVREAKQPISLRDFDYADPEYLRRQRREINPLTWVLIAVAGWALALKWFGIW